MPRREIIIYSSEDGSTRKRKGCQSQRIFDLSNPDKAVYPSEFFKPWTMDIAV